MKLSLSWQKTISWTYFQPRFTNSLVSYLFIIIYWLQRFCESNEWLWCWAVKFVTTNANGNGTHILAMPLRDKLYCCPYILDLNFSIIFINCETCWNVSAEQRPLLGVIRNFSIVISVFKGELFLIFYEIILPKQADHVMVIKLVVSN